MKRIYARCQGDARIHEGTPDSRWKILTTLRSHPANGRLVINISYEICKLENASVDIEMRAGDTLAIPKRPDFVMVRGQVYNPTAISYIPGKDAAGICGRLAGQLPSATKNSYMSYVPMGR
jgi:hypothetical protein